MFGIYIRDFAGIFVLSVAFQTTIHYLAVYLALGSIRSEYKNELGNKTGSFELGSDFVLDVGFQRYKMASFQFCLARLMQWCVGHQSVNDVLMNLWTTCINCPKILSFWYIFLLENSLHFVGPGMGRTILSELIPKR